MCIRDRIKHVHAAEVKEIVCRWEKERLNLPAELPLSNFLPTVENYEKKVSKKKLKGNEVKQRLESPKSYD